MLRTYVSSQTTLRTHRHGLNGHAFSTPALAADVGAAVRQLSVDGKGKRREGPKVLLYMSGFTLSVLPVDTAERLSQIHPRVSALQAELTHVARQGIGQLLSLENDRE